jgi:hypothetical protein
VPGTNPPVSLQLLKGWPLAIMRAVAADFNAFIAPLRDGDSAARTETNSVPTSNHLNATAMDLDWDDHPFHVRGTFNTDQMAVIRELLDFYEDTIFWAGDWNDPIDEMHWQMGYDTFNNPHTGDFIARKIRADGFSTFRRGGQAGPPAVMTVPLVQKPNGFWTSPSPAWAHLINRESGGNPTIIQQIIDVNSGGNEAEGLFQITPQTWRAHHGDEFAPSPRSATPQQQAIVAARIFTRNPSGSDWGAGLRGREDARELAAGLVPLTGPPIPGPIQGEDDLSAEAERKIDVIYQELTKPFASRSPLRHLGEGAIDTMAGFVLNTDGSVHVEIVRLLAGYGHPPTLALLREVAGADPNVYPDRQDDAKLAQAILAEVTSRTANGPGMAVVTHNTAAPAAPQIVYVDRPVAAPAPEPAPVALVEQTSNGQESTGQLIGAAYDALQKLRLADALPIEDRAPLAALISVLSTKNGAKL